jgi:hypothetical protein
MMSTPVRLLEIGAGGKSLRLRKCSELTTDLQFVTLSHCWDVHPSNFRLYKSNLDEFFASIAVQLLPKTFKEGLDVTWQLGYRYI